MERFTLLRFNKESLAIPTKKLISVDAGNGIIKVKYYDDDDNQLTESGYHLIHRWR